MFNVDRLVVYISTVTAVFPFGAVKKPVDRDFNRVLGAYASPN